MEMDFYGSSRTSNLVTEVNGVDSVISSYSTPTAKSDASSAG
jgi:hypothetical protein